MKTLLILLLSGSLMAQVHDSKPLPRVSKEPAHIIDEGITGWSYSKDGQWISADMKIPVRMLATAKEEYDKDENELGLDNILELRLYPVLFGEDTLVALVKIFENGKYDYEATKRGWDTYKTGYYFLFDASELSKLRDLDTTASVIKLNLRDFGSLQDVNTRRLERQLMKNMLVKSETDRHLAMSIRKSQEKVYFQFASMHEVFADLQGVLHGFGFRGQTLYGKPSLINYIHYEYGLEDFKNFFEIPSSVEFLEPEI